MIQRTPRYSMMQIKLSSIMTKSIAIKCRALLFTPKTRAFDRWRRNWFFLKWISIRIFWFSTSCVIIRAFSCSIFWSFYVSKLLRLFSFAWPLWKWAFGNSGLVLIGLFLICLIFVRFGLSYFWCLSDVFVWWLCYIAELAVPGIYLIVFNLWSNTKCMISSIAVAAWYEFGLQRIKKQQSQNWAMSSKDVQDHRIWIYML